MSLKAAKGDRVNMASLFYQSKQTTRPEVTQGANHLKHIPPTPTIQMVQYDPFVGMFPAAALPSRGRDAAQHSNNTEHNPGHNEFVHHRLRRLSTSGGDHPRCCSKCHLRLPSQEHRPALVRHDSTSSEEEWDGFCPDITMPKDLYHSASHRSIQRRHSSLCPTNVANHERKGSGSSPVQMLVKEQAADALAHHHNKCNCETIIPRENLDERYGLVEEPEEIRRKRDSLDQEAAGRLADIMHQELVSDMEARQCML
ncbi:hypothetical protein G647_05890 [Cladophialophora carrionii CBS 160.54]|uniref:Uncharacterized protein n=1 Tax=Cladophialophora carrionii CBS 160.54 TaxID=1279043 RepID=V9D588_9EURO|nr:uncharacterized protein G647_05890 [Cladophialophora carrionii CBS 160.54]ETI21821.1 hypothetical protein G647_05890 [Cladophialophora carrionii CBS 160.54]